MREQLDAALAALDKIEHRLGHYLKTNSSIPTTAVAGNEVMPGLAHELAEVREAVTDAKALFLASLDDHK